MITSLAAGRLGRFANGAFMICSSIGVARRNGQDFAFNKWINWDAKERFVTTEDIEVYKYFNNPLPLLTGNESFQTYGYFWGYRHLDLQYGNWSIEAHMQSEKYFSHCIDEVRYYMTMSDEEDHDAIALHYRGGDYIDSSDAYHPRCPLTYYAEALQHVPKDMPIFLFSDSMEDAVRIIGKLGRKYIPIDKDYLESFKIMKRCRHFITANSSYSLLAAILSNSPDKTVICPKVWFGPQAGLDTTDLYPQGAVIL